MAAISQMGFSDTFLWMPFRRRYFQMLFCDWKVCILIKILLKYVPKGPVDDNPALV